MNDKNLINLLLRSGLSPVEAYLYVFVLNNPGVSVSDSVSAFKFGKSTVYRAYEKLIDLDLIENLSVDSWKTSLKAKSLSSLAKKLKNDSRKDSRLISLLSGFNNPSLSIFSRLPGIEFLNEEETYQRYLDLSTQNWHSMLAYGNWEDLNNQNRNIVPVEKKFIDNRLKKGGKAFVVVTKEGPYTNQIVDFNDMDSREERETNISDDNIGLYWVNAFEDTDYIHLWFQNQKNELSSIFIESKPFADFHKNLIYSRL